MGRIVGLAFVLLLVCLVVGMVVAAHNRRVRAAHPSIETRRRALDRAIMAEEITPEEYAEKKLLLDHEEELELLTRRLR